MSISYAVSTKSCVVRSGVELGSELVCELSEGAQVLGVEHMRSSLGQDRVLLQTPAGFVSLKCLKPLDTPPSAPAPAPGLAPVPVPTTAEDGKRKVTIMLRFEGGADEKSHSLKVCCGKPDACVSLLLALSHAFACASNP